MKIYIAKNGLSVTHSTHEFKENDVVAMPFEVTQEQLDCVSAGTHDFDVVDGQPCIVESDRAAKLEEARQTLLAEQEAKKTRKLELIQKVTSGTATQEEQTEFANLL